MNRSRSALVVFWASIGVVVAMVLYLGMVRWQAAEEVNVESVGVRPTFSQSATPTPSTEPSASASASPSASPSPSVEPGPVYVAAPQRLRIPALDVNTKVFPVGLDKNKAIEIPEDIRYVGWYDLGVPPGVDRGSAVLVAHRDGREQGRGVFYFLGTLDVGDKVYVKTTAGDELPYRVVSRESILKKRLPYEELFAVDGDPRLTLISCGGYYDPDNGGYQDNVVVTAVPLFTPISTGSSPSASPTASPSVSADPSASSSVTSSPSAEATSASGPVAVAAPEAATIADTSMPVLFNGTVLK